MYYQNDGLTPANFSKLSTEHSRKWLELFRHAKVALGCASTEAITSSAKCDKAWQKVAVIFANLNASKTRSVSCVNAGLSGHDFLAQMILFYLF